MPRDRFDFTVNGIYIQRRERTVNQRQDPTVLVSYAVGGVRIEEFFGDYSAYPVGHEDQRVHGNIGVNDMLHWHGIDLTIDQIEEAWSDFEGTSSYDDPIQF
jgi:hypothetical protein